MAIATFSDGHRWTIDGHRWDLNYRSAHGAVVEHFGLNISNFDLLSFPFEPEQAFSSLKITYIGALSLNCWKKLENLAKLQLFAKKMRRNRASIAEKAICL